MFHLNKVKLFLTFFLFFFMPVIVNAIVKPTSEFYVNDYADILSDETERYILEKSVALNKVDGTQIVVVTVPNLEGISIEEYAYQLFQQFGIGDREKDNGLLLLLAKEERIFRVEVGNGLEGILPDGKTGRFQDEYIIPYLKENKWNEGIKNGYDAFYREIVTLNNLNLSYSKPNDLNETIVISDISYIIFIFSCVLGFISGIILSCISGKNSKLLIIVVLINVALIVIFGYLIPISWICLLIFGCLQLYFISFVLSFQIFGGFCGRGGSSGSFGGGFSGGGFFGGGGSSSGGGSSRGF